MIRRGVIPPFPALVLMALPAAAVETHDCVIDSLCRVAGGGACIAMTAPMDLTLMVGADGTGAVLIDGLRADLSTLGTARGATSYLARHRDRALAMLTHFDHGRIVLLVQDLAKPNDTAILDGACGSS